MNKNFAYISVICGEASLGQMCMKFRTTGLGAHVINLRQGFDSVGGEILGFFIGK